MVDSRYMKAFTEVDLILKNTDPKLVEMIPVNIRDYIRENQDENYVFILSSYIPLEDQDIMEETRNILSLFDLLYWSNDSEKIKFLKKNKNEISDIEEIMQFLNVKPIINKENIFAKLFKR